MQKICNQDLTKRKEFKQLNYKLKKNTIICKLFKKYDNSNYLIKNFNISKYFIKKFNISIFFDNIISFIIINFIIIYNKILNLKNNFDVDLIILTYRITLRYSL